MKIILLHAIKWMNFEDILLRQMSQMQKISAIRFQPYEVFE